MRMATELLAAPGARPAEGVAGSWVARFALPGRRQAEAALEVAGEVPLRAARDGCTVLFDGVLHDEGLRRELGEEAHDAASDAELLLRAYRHAGPGFLDRLRGRFALIVRDEPNARVLCARDPLGIHPLFYAERDGELLLSPSIDALLADARVPGAVDRTVVAGHLCHRWFAPDATYFEAVRRVPPGHVLIADSGGLRSRRFWDPVPPGEPVRWISDHELEHFPDLFAQAVDRCLDLGPAGIFLSGGLDSVSVAAEAVDRAGSRGLPAPQPLSLVFPDAEANEEEVQRGVARALGLPPFLLGFDEALQGKPALVAAVELSARRATPLQSMWTPAYLQLADEGVSRGVRTVLTGTGGDEWLTVTPLLAPDLLRSLDFRGLARVAAAHRRSYRVTATEVWRRLLWKYGTRPLLSAVAGTVLRAIAPWLLRTYRRRVIERGTPSWVAPDAALRAELMRRAQESWPARPQGSYYFHELRESLEHPLVAMEMEEIHENGREAGVRFAAPFLDADLVDFLYRTPLDALNRGGRSKGLVRDHLSTRFPALGFERQKKVTATSFARHLQTTQGRLAWERLGGVQALVELGVVDDAGFRRFFDAATAGRDPDTYYRIWETLSLEAWLRPRL